MNMNEEEAGIRSFMRDMPKCKNDLIARATVDFLQACMNEVFEGYEYKVKPVLGQKSGGDTVVLGAVIMVDPDCLTSAELSHLDAIKRGFVELAESDWE